MEQRSCQKPPMHSKQELSQRFVKQGMTGLTQPTTATESNMRGSSLISIRPGDQLLQTKCGSQPPSLQCLRCLAWTTASETLRKAATEDTAM